MRIPCLAILVFVVAIKGIAQEYRDPVTWSNIETAIKNKKNLAIARNRIGQLKEVILKNKDYTALARFYHYQILVDDQRTEDTFYFRNSSFIDSLLYDAGSPQELKVLLHIMQAKRIALFRIQDLKFNRARYEIKGQRYNYAAFTNIELDSIIHYHFNEAKKKVAANKSPVEDILWLSSSPFIFLFKPSLADIIFAEQITYVRGTNSLKYSLKEAKRWMQLSPDDFIIRLDSLRGAKNPNQDFLPVYYEWMQLHRTDTSAYYFIEMLARQSLKNRFDSDTAMDKLYEKYLQQQSSLPLSEVRAYSVYHLCMLWFDWSERYVTSASASYRLNDRWTKKEWDTSCQYLPAKALQLFEENAALFERYSRLQRELLLMKKAILSKEIEWEMDDESSPVSPLLVRLEYKNTSRVYYRIVRVYNKEEIPYKKQAALPYLLSKAVVQEKEEALLLPPDHNSHKTFLKIDSLAVGRYYLLFADHPIQADDTLIKYQSFTITSVAVMHTDGRVYIVNRKTGMPLEGATVKVYYTKKSKDTTIKREDTLYSYYRVNNRGYFDLPKEEYYRLQIIYQGDTIRDYADVEKEEIESDAYVKKKDEDLVDYYDDNAEVHILTDRSIYRPGQKVFYKAIFVTKDRRTGKPVIMNEQNLRKGWFKNYLKRWKKDMEPLLYFTDPFGREIDSVKIAPDDYGAMSGSFTIPKTAATGEWKIEADYVSTNYDNRGRFQVEEYKRPTYELTLDKPEKIYKPGDTIFFVLQAKSFSGVKMGNTRINYSVKRYSSLSGIYESSTFSGTMQLLDTVGFTDDKGRLTIKVVDTALQKAEIDKNSKITFTYNLNATATAATGESHDVKGDIKVSTRPVNINISLREARAIEDWRPVLITTKDVNGLDVPREVEVKVYRVDTSVQTNKINYSFLADQWIYPAKDWQQWFPHISFFTPEREEKEDLVYTTTLHTANFEKLRMPKEMLLPGKYKLVATCIENGKIAGEQERLFTLFDVGSGKVPGKAFSFFHLPANGFYAGDTLQFYSGSSYDSTYAIMQIKYFAPKNKKLQIHSFFQEQKKGAGITSWKWKIPEDATDFILLTQLFVVNNQVYRYSEEMRIDAFRDYPQIIVKQFRSQLTPGATTSFSVSVKTKDKNVAAELVSTLYDASLDRIEPHKWRIPYPEYRRSRLNNEWPSAINGRSSETYRSLDTTVIRSSNKAPVWWLNSGSIPQDMERQQGVNPLLSLQGRVPGLTLTHMSSLDETLVIAYGTTTRRFNTGSISKTYYPGISPHAIANLVGNNKPLMFLDGVPFTGDLSSIKISELTEAVILRDADATALYGSRAAQGVLFLSTKGPVIIPEIKPEVPIQTRKNFNETAFFLPSVHADKDGYYYFNFTMPESVTEWNWKILGHTKDARFAYSERKLVTNLPLTVQPNVPRLLYQGDHILLKTRISNMDSIDRKGTLTCKIEDEVTGEDVTAALITNTVNSFTIAANRTLTLAFKLIVPVKQLNPLKITIAVQAGNISDAEEHSIPILSTASLIKETIPFNFLQNDTAVSIPAGVGDLYGIGVAVNPLPQAAIVNALPFLANYSFDCAEQTFNKMLANTLAVQIMRTDKEVQKMFSVIRNKVERDTNNKAPEPEEQITPWLSLANKTRNQQDQLYDLLDTGRSIQKVEDYLDRLRKLQNEDGGLTWFDGGKSDPVISAYVLAGFGKMEKDSLTKLRRLYDYWYDGFIKKLVDYCDEQLKDKIKEEANYCVRQLIYARSFWLKKFMVDAKLHQSITDFLAKEWTTIDRKLLSQQTFVIINTIRFFNSGEHALYHKAVEQLESIRQLAIQDENGVRWKDIADGDDLSLSSEETLALLAEAFELGYLKKMPAGIAQWLLTTQSEHHWQTTKATAAALKLLHVAGHKLSDATMSIDATIAGKELTVSNSLLQGNPFSFIKTSISTAIPLKKTTEGVASGNITAYYFRPWDQLRQTGNGISLSKELLYWQNDHWVPVKERTTLKLGDKVKVVLHIATPKSLQYVYINENRPAAFEPVDASSGYQYSNGFSYYQSVRDAGCQFFAEFIPAGNQTISYEVTVAQEGDFSCGPASLECMYRPDVHAYSNGLRVMTLP